MSNSSDEFFSSTSTPSGVPSGGAVSTEHMGGAGVDNSHSLNSEEVKSVGEKREASSSIIAARGTSDGLILRIDGRVQFESLEDALRGFLEERKKFFSGNPVFLEWVGEIPEPMAAEGIMKILEQEFGISIKKTILKQSELKTSLVVENIESSDLKHSKESSLRVVASSNKANVQSGSSTRTRTEKDFVQNKGFAPNKAAPDKLERGYVMTSFKNDEEKEGSLFGGISSFPQGADLVPTGSWDEPNAKLVTATLRSGQRIESEHSIIVLGDVNSGAEVVAGGDVIVLGALRGVAHAGAYDETGGGRVIIAHSLQPTQLRIGSTISRGLSSKESSGKDHKGDRTFIAEIARVDGTMISVEGYSAKNLLNIRRDS